MLYILIEHNLDANFQVATMPSNICAEREEEWFNLSDMSAYVSFIRYFIPGKMN
jgi:hypothetical protein